MIDAELKALVSEVVGEVLKRRAGADQLAYSVPAAAKLLGRSASTVRRMVSSGELRTVQVSRCKMVPRSELERLTSPATSRETASRSGRRSSWALRRAHRGLQMSSARYRARRCRPARA